MTTLPGLVATLGLTLGLLLGTAGLASAQNWSGGDASGDVLRVTGDNSLLAVVQPEGRIAEPSRVRGDVVRTSVSHTRTKVVIRITMRAIPTGDWMGMTTIRAPSTSYDLFHMRFGGRSGVSLTKTHGNGRELPCRAKSSRIDGRSLILTVSRACLGKPRVVRVGAGVAAVASGVRLAYVDDANRRGAYADITHLQLSPVLRRG